LGEIQRFEDLVAWQLAREVTREVYTVTREGAFGKDFALVDQMRRSAISVMSNLAEGFERETDADRLRFYSMAKASCAELRSQLYVASDAGYITEATLKPLRDKTERIARVIGGLRTAIGRSLRTPNGRQS
jgi:four helix bundle protein